MKIEFNLKIILFLITFFIVRNINTYIIFLIFTLVHELAHLFVGIIIGGIPKKLSINPFGISLEFYTYGKKNPIFRILFYAIGPLFNFAIAIILLGFENKNQYLYEIIYTNIAIGIFNLLPILPLDGGKILREVLKIFLDLRHANKYSILSSKIVLCLITFCYAILILIVKNMIVVFLLAYLWYLYEIEEKKFNLYEKTSNAINALL